MGFFDKVKHFAGGHGVKVEHVEIERQPVAGATLPITDTVVKGKFAVTADKACEVLSMKAEFCVSLTYPDGIKDTLVLGEDVFPKAHCTRMGDMLQYPHTMAAGARVVDYFNILMGKDIPAVLAEKKVAFESCQFFVRTMVDVKGSPFDPEAKDPIHVTA
jgi:hypothetical protein